MNARQAHVIIQERKKLQGQLGDGNPGFKVRCVVAVARNMLLQGTYFWKGRSCNPLAKSIGAGVWEIWLEDGGLRDRVGK